MRKVSKEIAEAFTENVNKIMGNTRIRPISEWSSKKQQGVFLHDNKIAWFENNHPSENLSNNIHLCFSMCGWDTPTTRERLNTIFAFVFGWTSVEIRQRKGNQILFIDDRQIEINENLNYVIRSVHGDVFLDDPIKNTG